MPDIPYLIRLSGVYTAFRIAFYHIQKINERDIRTREKTWTFYIVDCERVKLIRYQE